MNVLLIGAAGSQDKIDALGFETLPLKSFTSDETQTLLEKTFFRIEQQTDFAQWLHKQSGGNPLFIVEILKTLYNNNVLYFESNQWQIKTNALKEITIPKKLDDLLAARLRELGDEELKILKILSLANYPLEPTIISSILKIDVSITTEHLKNLRLLHEEIINNRRVITIPNQILNEIIEKNINTEERRTFSDSLIQSIETAFPEEKDYFPLLAQLSDEVGRKEKAYRYFRSAAHDAEAIYDYDSALIYYKKLADFSEEMRADKYPELLVKIGDLHYLVGKTEMALNYYNMALRYETANLQSKIFYSVGKIYNSLGRYHDAAEYLQRALLHSGAKSTNYIRAANSLGHTLANLSKFEEAETILDKSLALSKELKDIQLA